MDDDQAHELEALEGVLSDPSAEPIKLSYGLMKFITENFSNEIGRGGFGVVYQGGWHNWLVAVKKTSNAHDFSDKLFMDEIKCLRSARHKNIVRFLGYCADTQEEIMPLDGTFVMAGERNRLLCFEYVPRGNIRQYLEREKPHGDDWLARYQMIRGICHGLQYLHDKHINHLDLKPENVMLDANMEAKITDFGLSRLLDEGQSKMITKRIIGTLRYIAPEVIDKGEISFKSDIYALGIIIIELLTGTSMISLQNWDEALEVLDCPQARRCTEIARNCTDADRDKRPAVSEIICDLDEVESMIPRPFINQVTPGSSTFSWTDHVYPLELRFPFVPAQQEMQCHLSLTNKNTDGVLSFAIIPEIPDRYRGRLQMLLLPMCTVAITLRRDPEEELLPSETDRLEILILITGCDADVFNQQISTLSLGKDASFQDTFQAAHELLGFELHRMMLTAVVVASEDDDKVLVADTVCQEEETTCISSIDVHPTEPWVLLIERQGTVYIWNWHTNKKIGAVHKSRAHPEVEGRAGEFLSAKFIPQKQWVVTGSSSGYILVCTCPTMDQVKEFEAHSYSIVTSLAVHPTRPFVLSFSYFRSLKLWDWNNDWSCVGVFDIDSPVKQVMFNLKHTNTFATYDDTAVKMWRIGHSSAISTLKHYGNSRRFTYTGDRHFIATIHEKTVCVRASTSIWDLQKEKHVHTLFIEETKENSIIVDVVCHPTRPVLVTASTDGCIHVWDSTTYRLKKAYANLPGPLHIGFTGGRRLVIMNVDGIISFIDIDME